MTVKYQIFIFDVLFFTDYHPGGYNYPRRHGDVTVRPNTEQEQAEKQGNVLLLKQSGRNENYQEKPSGMR
jgi:hypothetical protein